MTNGSGHPHDGAGKKKAANSKRQDKAKGPRTAADVRKETLKGKSKT